MPIPANPLSGRDEWAVFADGRVAVVRHDDYRVEFVESAGERFSGPSLWVQRLEEFGATGTVIDVLDKSGRISYRVRIRDGHSVAGFGSGVVCTACTDADGIKRLHRHRMP